MFTRVPPAILLCVTVGGVAHAQTNATSPSTRLPRLDVGVSLSWTTMSPVTKDCCQLRTPPSFQQVDQSQTTPLAGFDLRITETRWTSTVVQMGWGAAFTYNASYARPSSIDPFTTYVAERGVSSRPSLDLGLMQTLQFSATTRVQAYVGGGILLSRLSADQKTVLVAFNDPAFRTLQNDNWVLTRWGATLIGGVTFRPAHYAFVDVSGGARSLGGVNKTDADRSTWAVPQATSPVVRVTAGVTFR